MRAEKTAIARTQPSYPTSHFVKVLKRQGAKRILDWGCGRGRDVDWLTRQGYEVFGYDPHFKPVMPTGTYDAVICNYVLCVLPPDKRDDVFRLMLPHLKKDGLLCAAVRPKHEVDRWAKKSGWTKSWDGWETGAGTFQKGYSKPEFFKVLDGHGFGNVVASWCYSWTIAFMVRSGP